jgi:hypothetical protein
MAQAVEEVRVGPSDIYTAALSTAFPANAETAPSASWEHVGYSEAGAAFQASRTFEDTKVHELASPVRTDWTEADYQLVVVLAQFSLENLQLYFNGGTITPIAGPPVRRTFTPPAIGGDTGMAVLCRFANEYGFHTDLQIPSAKSVEALDIPLKKAPDKSLIAVTFKVQLVSGSQPFTFDEYTAAA